jgi:transcriptional antiterminator RfaH
LDADGIETYYPRLPVRTVNPRARKVQPYFPGYLFVHIDVGKTGLVKFKWMPFCSGLVCFDDVPAPVPDPLIDGIRRTIDKLTRGGTQFYDELVHGQPVRVRSGAFEGYTGIFDARLSGGERVRLLLDLLNGRSAVAVVEAARVEPLKRHQGIAR